MKTNPRQTFSGDKRRIEIFKILKKGTPAIGSSLAEKFGVSRQVIVQDIALLRAQGFKILATPQGYISLEAGDRMIRTIASKHIDLNTLEDELLIIVRNGGSIIDVIVEHPVYGELRGMLMIRTDEDARAFTRKLIKSGAEPLCALTKGIHIHNIEVPDEDSYKRIINELKNKGYLLQE